MMKKLLFLYFLLIPGTCFTSDNTIKYISLGLRIGWDFGHGLTVGARVSLGLYSCSGLIGSKYINITKGLKAPLFRKLRFSYEGYNFVQLQFGFAPFPDNPLHLGGGLGTIFYHDENKIIFKPMTTISSGFLVFTELDILFLERNKISKDFGILGIIPIAIGGLDLGLE